MQLYLNLSPKMFIHAIWDFPFFDFDHPWKRWDSATNRAPHIADQYKQTNAHTHRQFQITVTKTLQIYLKKQKKKTKTVTKENRKNDKDHNSPNNAYTREFGSNRREMPTRCVPVGGLGSRAWWRVGGESYFWKRNEPRKTEGIKTVQRKNQRASREWWAGERKCEKQKNKL